MEFLGLRGLYMAALRKGDRDRAQDLAARAYALRPKAPWVVNALFELRTQSADWGAAGQTLDAMGKAKLLDPGVTKRRRAVLRAAQAMQAEMAGDQQQALAFAQEAVGIAPGLTAAALLAAKRLAGLGRTWKASAILEQAWAKEPHPEIARAYAALKPDEAQRARSVRLAGLAGQNADHPESRILSASLALANGDWRAAKETMRPLSGSFPSARMCTLMADIERMAGDEAESRGWSARAIKAQRDAVWACASCARQYPDWSALCPGCEAFDSLTWLSGAADKVSKLPEGGLSGAQADMGDLDLALYRAAVKRAPDVGPAPAPRPQQPVDTVVEAPPQAAAVPDIVRPPLPDDPGPDAADWDDADAAARRKGAGW
jgi:HemY protein